MLIAVDEAEYLAKWDVDKFEVLRKVWDNTGTPVILCGTDVLEGMLTAAAATTTTWRSSTAARWN